MTKKYRDAHDMFLVYGSHLIDKAKEKDALIEIITSNEEMDGTYVSMPLMEELQQTEGISRQLAEKIYKELH